MLTRASYQTVLSAYGLAALAVLLAAPFFGSVTICLREALVGCFMAPHPPETLILLEHRLPRVLLGFGVGAALAGSGAVLQVVLANPLAEPFVLGVAGAGGLGAALALTVPGLLLAVGPFSTVQVFALLGCLLALTPSYLLARRTSAATLLLAGVTLNFLCGAGVVLLRYLADPYALTAMDRWMLGGLDVVGYAEVLTLPLLALPGSVLMLWRARALNHLLLGDGLAHGQGVDAGRERRLLLAGVGLASAAAVAAAGPVSFIGLMAPHAVKRLSGRDQRLVLPASMLLGGALLVACDALARVAAAPRELPVGVVTTLVGGPFFLWLLFGGRGRT